MKKIYLLLCFMIACFSAEAQSVSATYNAGDISTNAGAYSSTCNGPLTTLSLTLPSGGSYQVTSVDVSYDFIAQGGAWLSEQRSQIFCQNTSSDEGGDASVAGNNGGTQSYNRTGLNIANGTYAGGTNLVFEMRAWRTWPGGSGCNTTYNYIDDGTWTVTVNYISLGLAATAVTTQACSGSNGTITLSATGGTAPYEYSKDNGTTWQNSNVFTGLASGSYNMRVRDSATPTPDEFSFTESIASGISTNVSSIVTNTSCGLNDGAIDLTITGALSDIRKIRITQDNGATAGDNWTLNLQELQAFELFGGNVALGKTVSSNVGSWPGFSHQNLTNGVFNDGGTGMAHTQGVVSPDHYLEVDLGSSYHLDYVKIFGRTGCCYVRHQNLKIDFYDSSGSIVYTTNVDASTSPYEATVNLLDASWLDGATTLDRTGVAVGSYSFTVANATGCETESTYVVDVVSSTLSASSTITDAGCGLSNGAVDLTPSNGAPNEMLSFNGSNNFVSVPYSTDLNPAQFTVSCWVKLNGGSGNRSPITSRLSTAGNQRGYIFYAEPGNTWQFWTGTPGTWNVTNGPAVSLGNWTHLSATYNGTTQTFYVDGVQVGANNVTYTPNNINILNIGRGENNFYFPGSIDEVGIWDRALSAAEIAALYNAERADEVGLSNLKGYFPLNEGTGTTINNKVGTQTGSFVNSPSWNTADWNMWSDNTGYLYAWNNGANTQDVSSIPQGSYTCTITDGLGCVYEESVIVQGCPMNSLLLSTCDDNCISLVAADGISPYLLLDGTKYGVKYGKIQKHTINNTYSSAIDGYQVELDIPYDSDMRSDFGDLRFYDAKGRILNYYIKDATSPAKIFVKMDLELGDNTMYMTYGNAALTSLSNPAATLEIYEDMTSAPSGTLRNTAFYDATNQYVRLTQAVNSVSGQLEYTYDFEGGFSADYEFWAGPGGADANFLYPYSNQTVIQERDVTNSNIGYTMSYQEYYGFFELNWNVATAANMLNTFPEPAANRFDNSTWHDATVRYFGNTIQMDYDGANYVDYTDVSRTMPGNLFGFGARTGGANNEHRIRNIEVRKYVGSLVSVTLGVEEDIDLCTYTPGTHSGIFIVDASGNFNVEDNIKVADYAAKVNVNTTGALQKVCEYEDWIYYGNNTTDEIGFGMLWNDDYVANGANHNKTPLNNATVNITEDGFDSEIDMTSFPIPFATYGMSRYWNVNNASLDGAVDLRFFYDSSDKTNIENTAQAFATANGIAYEAFKWFKIVGADYDPSTHLTAKEVIGEIELTAVSGGAMIDGELYAQFDGITGFSGGTGASGAGNNASSALPVELIYITANEVDNEYIEVDWATATEVNNAGFDVLRSTNGVDFENIAWVEGHGNAVETHIYSFYDHEVNKDVEYYYKLKQVDYDGQFEWTNVVSAKLQNENNLAVQLFPNPASDLLMIKTNNQKEDLKVVFYDAIGKIVRKETLNAGSSNHVLNIENLDSGLYTVNIVTKDSMITNKLVIDK